jgi:nitric oxide reductase subunit B
MPNPRSAGKHLALLLTCVQQGYFAARSLKYLMNPTNALIEWLHLPGDALFIVGGVLPFLYLCWLGVRHMPQRVAPPQVGPFK